jgi:hypothetical protein
VTFRERIRRIVTRLLAFALILSLCAAVAFLLSKLNERTYSTEVRGGSLVILKGRPLPFGSEPFHPADTAQAEAYAPIPLQGRDANEVAPMRFTDRDELDRALFDLLVRLARPKLDSEDPDDFKRGAYDIERAAKLSGLSPQQRQSLKQVQQEISVFLAKTKLEDARRLLQEGRAELKLAAEAQGQKGQNASQALSALAGPAVALEEALDSAVHLLATPPGPSPSAPTERKQAP